MILPSSTPLLVFDMNGAGAPLIGSLLARFARGGVAMKRQSRSKPYAWLIAFRWDGTTESSPILLFVAVCLFLILAILEIDLHDAELRLLGLLGEDSIDPALMGP